MFADELHTFSLKVQTKVPEVFTGVVDETHRSIQLGSEITGAPGQPVDTGNLRASWEKWYDSPTQATIATNVVYAPYIEEGMNSRGGFTLRSAVGGFHSVKMTVAGFQRIVDMVTKSVKGNA